MPHNDRRAAIAPLLLSLATGSYVAIPACARVLLPAPVTFTHCVVDSNVSDGAMTCILPGSALADLTLSPVTLAARASSPAVDASGIHGATAAAGLTYSFEVLGGSPGDIVPIFIATTLATTGTDPSHAFGFATLQVHTGAAADISLAVCSNASCGTAGSSFSGAVSTRARSGDAGNALTLQVQAATGDSIVSGSASASADPFIFIDPSFPGASRYSVEVSPGIGNSAAVPEPSSGTLLAVGVLTCSVRRGLAHRLACHC